MSRRQHVGSPLSLFAFQDIITATTGILILITLILCMSISNRPMQESDTTPDINKKKSELAAMESEIESLKKESDRVQKTASLLVGMANTNIERSVEASKVSLDRLAQLIAQARANLSISAAALADSDDVQHLQAEKKTLKELLEELENRRSEFEQLTDSKRIVYNFRQSGQEVPWLLEVTDKKLVVARSGTKEAPKIFDHGSIRQRLGDFDAWLNSLPPRDRYFVALVRPAGAEIFGAIRPDNSVRALLDTAGAVVGIDLLPEGQEVIDPVTGASF